MFAKKRNGTGQASMVTRPTHRLGRAIKPFSQLRSLPNFAGIATLAERRGTLNNSPITCRWMLTQKKLFLPKEGLCHSSCCTTALLLLRSRLGCNMAAWLELMEFSFEIFHGYRFGQPTVKAQLAEIRPRYTSRETKDG